MKYNIDHLIKTEPVWRTVAGWILGTLAMLGYGMMMAIAFCGG